ncbi:3-methyladenine DNA glycosylase [Helicobacter baculiformis]|uniref:3-methyladenine DNA glycosylase n=1 Tax=Helicobacter baculiformis TaxID=427351 RepID=A0ABV7ZIV9_9HELI|nr:3-methyladenine DNA glycosylase [Helicobacter baculiformis]
MLTSLEILRALKTLNLLKNAPPLWWPGAGSFEVVVGAILTQNTRFEQAHKSLENLKSASALNLHSLAHIDLDILESCIKPSGFHRQKARYITLLSQHILQDFNTFEIFQKEVSRTWLLVQKGIGFESADAILNYACLRPVMVVDRYTYQLLKSLGLDLPDYSSLQEFFMHGIEADRDQTLSLYNHQLDLASIYARFHGKIVACMRAKINLNSHLKGYHDLY